MANSSTKDALHSVTKHNDISISGVSSNEVLRFDGTNSVNSLPSSSLVVTQSSHGFSVGDVLKSSGSNGAYAKAQANNAGNAEVLGIVTAVADTNTFTLTVSGYITTAAAVPNVTAGSALFLSASTAGALTATEPSTAGQISKPVAIVTTANAAMIIVAYRGETISTGANNWDVNGSELVLDADGDTSLTADTDDQIDIKISGADDFRFTANNLNVLSGSTLTIDSGATIANSGTATGFSSGPSQAIQSAIEAETNQDTYVPPDLLKHSPGVAKGWVEWDSGSSIEVSYNVTSVTDNGQGDQTITWATDFSGADYCVVGCNVDDRFISTSSTTQPTAGATRMQQSSEGGSPVDASHTYVAAFGDQ